MDLIRGSLRDVDSLYRLGGDEFCILIEGSEPLDALKIPAQRIIDSLSEGFVYDTAIFKIGASIGISSTLINAHINSIQMISDADKAMYEAKRNGKNNYVFFQSNTSSK